MSKPLRLSERARRTGEPPISWLMKFALEHPECISLAAGFVDGETLPVEVVGEVVELRQFLNWFERRPLFGRTVVVTRPEGQAASLARDLTDLGAEVLELGGPEAAGVELKDAYGRYEVRDAFRVQVGRFKKPFSRLKMSSSWELPVPVRGLLNRHAVGGTSHGGFGGRDIGLMIFGRMKGLARLRYYVGAFGGDGLFEGRRESHKDFVARLQVRPFKGLTKRLLIIHKAREVELLKQEFDTALLIRMLIWKVT